MANLTRLRDWARRLKADVLTLWFAVRHPGAPWLARALGLLAVGYALSPIDLIPDFIPVLGLVDDLLLLPVLLWLALRLMPRPVIEAARRQADEWIAAKRARPSSRMAAAIIVLLWLVAAALLVAWIRIRRYPSAP